MYRLCSIEHGMHINLSFWTPVTSARKSVPPAQGCPPQYSQRAPRCAAANSPRPVPRLLLESVGSCDLNILIERRLQNPVGHSDKRVRSLDRKHLRIIRLSLHHKASRAGHLPKLKPQVTSSVG